MVSNPRGAQVPVVEVLSVAAAVLGAVGGAGAIILGLSAWLGKIAADRIMQAETARYAEQLEKLTADLRRQTETALERVKSTLERETDAVVRRRAVYDRIAVAMRIFVGGHSPATHEQKSEFLAAYDLAVLWAPDPVVDALNRFLDAVVSHTARPDPNVQRTMRTAYVECLMEMRRDAGFRSTETSYRLVSF